MVRVVAAAATASSHASTSAIAVAAREKNPASPFAQLLRSSRFATFDPQIRKTYYAPKQFVERGYWGLKRPITQRKKNSFVTIKQWEARQHYAEWDNAEDQVRFIRRMEELDVRPGQSSKAVWARQLGQAKTTWLVDSEFCPHEWNAEKEAEAEDQVGAEGPDVTAAVEDSGVTAAAEESNSFTVAAEESPDLALEETVVSSESDAQTLQKQDPIALEDLGKRGPGQYGVHSTHQQPTDVFPNIEAMSPTQLKRYLAKLRELRPAFKEYIQREAEREETDGSYPLLRGKSLFGIAQIPQSAYHRRFLAEHTQREYLDPHAARIQPQPHRNAGLMYAHPSMVDSLFRTRAKPGIVLAEHNTGRFKADKPQYIAAFAGLAATLPVPQSGEHMPLMEGAGGGGGVQRENWPHAVAALRPANHEPLFLHGVPRVVGSDPDEGLHGVRLALTVTARAGAADPRRPNPYRPGSRMYISAEPLDAPKGAAAKAAAAGPAPAAAGTSMQNAPMRVGGEFPSSTLAATSAPAMMSERDKATNANTLSVLANLLKSPQGSQASVRDDDLG